MGAEAIKELLMQIDLEELSSDLKTKLATATGQKKIRIVRRLEVVEALRTSGNRPEWMILDVIDVYKRQVLTSWISVNSSMQRLRISQE